MADNYFWLSVDEAVIDFRGKEVRLDQDLVDLIAAAC